jgi:cytochrome c peroxidase
MDRAERGQMQTRNPRSPCNATSLPRHRGAARGVLALGALIALPLLTAVAQQPSLERAARRYARQYVRAARAPAPAENRTTPARVALGKSLFFDPRLSRSRFVSCGSCHNPALSWSDGNPRATGDEMKTLGRRTPTLLNIGWAEAMFWDGRANTLEQQALGPITAPAEMNVKLDDLVARLQQVPAYVKEFDGAYPHEGITGATVGKAIAAYERTIVSGRAPFDRWVAGDARAISDEAKRGFVLFNTTARCSQCHSGWRFTDDGFQDIGLETDDPGRGKIVDFPEVQHAFKTPTLREVARRAPYMHDGSVAKLEDVIELYDRGGDVQRPSLSAEIRPLHLSAADKHALVAFLQTLTSDDPPTTLPVLPR